MFLQIIGYLTKSAVDLRSWSQTKTFELNFCVKFIFSFAHIYILQWNILVYDKVYNCSLGAISPLFRNIFKLTYIYISNLRSQMIYLFVKFWCSICSFLNFANLICRSTDISKRFRGSLRLRHNES